MKAVSRTSQELIYTSDYEYTSFKFRKHISSWKYLGYLPQKGKRKASDTDTWKITCVIVLLY